MPSKTYEAKGMGQALAEKSRAFALCTSRNWQKMAHPILTLLSRQRSVKALFSPSSLTPMHYYKRIYNSPVGWQNARRNLQDSDFGSFAPKQRRVPALMAVLSSM